MMCIGLAFLLSSLSVFADERAPKISNSTIYSYNGQSTLVVTVENVSPSTQILSISVEGIQIEVSDLVYAFNGTIIISGNVVLDDFGNLPINQPKNITLIIGEPKGTITVDNICGVSDSQPPVFAESVVNWRGSTTGSNHYDNSLSQPIVSKELDESVIKPNNSNKISVIPNPTVDEVNIITVDEIMFGTVNVIDMAGKLVMTINVNSGNSHNLRFNVSHLKEGLYLLKFETNKDKYVRKLKVVR